MTPNSHRQAQVFWRDCYSFGVHGAQIGVLENADDKRLGGFLQSADRGRLKSNGVRLADLANEPVKRRLVDDQLSRFLISANLLQSQRSRAILRSCRFFRCRRRKDFPRLLAERRSRARRLCVCLWLWIFCSHHFFQVFQFSTVVLCRRSVVESFYTGFNRF